MSEGAQQHIPGSTDGEQNLHRALIAAISGLGQIRDPLQRARAGTRLIGEVQQRLSELAEVRARAVAEAVQWPGQSLATVAESLDLSKQAIARLVTPTLKKETASEMRQRLAASFDIGANEGRVR
jgi:hypothetical protein